MSKTFKSYEFFNISKGKSSLLLKDDKGRVTQIKKPCFVKQNINKVKLYSVYDLLNEILVFTQYSSETESYIKKQLRDI